LGKYLHLFAIVKVINVSLSSRDAVNIYMEVDRYQTLHSLSYIGRP